MKRAVLRAAGLLILVLVLLISIPLSGENASVEPDPATITDYRAAFEVARNGDVDVVETLRVSFPVDRHGIFRFFDLVDPQDSGVRLAPRDISVTRDGTDENFEELTEGGGRYRNLKIGSAEVTITGEHVYEISYTVPDAISPAAGGASQFRWNVIPGGWRMPIAKSKLTVQLPVAPGALTCDVGAGQSGGCTAVAQGKVVSIQTGALPPNTPVTLGAALDISPPARAQVPWSIGFDSLLGRSVTGVVVILLLALGAAMLGAKFARGTREKKPQFPLMYGPPEGIGPAQGAYLCEERVGKEAFVATIMHTAERGATRLDHVNGWTISDAGEASRWSQLDPVSTYALQSLGVQGGAFHANKSAGSGETLKNALGAFGKATKGWAEQNKLITRAGIGSLGGVLTVGAILAALAIGLANPFGISLLALIPGLFAVMAVELLFKGASTKRTAAGRELWSRVGGFRRVLATPSSEARFDFSGRKEAYTAFIPWAVALGVADEWAAKYRLETGEEPPSPAYFGAAGYAAGSGGFASSMVQDFSATVDSAISAYEATQASS
ncbi:MAG: DUF2207 domain-containing protein, partial [Marmoricola sp.]